jgi:thiol:disulfide interchange protein DsbD
MVTYGYSGTVLLMARLTPPAGLKPGTRLQVGATASWLVCKDMCVPGKVEVALDLPVGDGKPGPDAPQFDAARTRIPAPLPAGWTAWAQADGGKITITISGTGNQLRQPVLFIPLVPDLISNTAPQKLARESSAWKLSLSRPEQPGKLPKSLSGVLLSGGYAWELDVPFGAPASRGGPVEKAGGSAAADIGFLWSLVLAFVGGMILNLMPCVFPVLSIKVLGFVRESTHNPREVRLHGILYGMGVVVSFVALALLLIVLRAGGQQLGWGFQLQSPVIILILTVVLFLLSLNLLGVFEVGTSIVRATGKFSWHEGRLGAFLTGVLATLLATPCTAPFMGTAVGFAATQPAASGLGVFAFLGLGMAAPYVALSFAPRLGRLLPKPGRWMETFKQLMAFPLLATVIWLLWVLGLQAGMMGIMGALTGLLVAGIAAWLYGRWHTSLMRVVAVALVIGGILLAVMGIRSGSPAAGSAAAGEWQEFSRAKLELELAKGNPVFVDFTAAWCLTCKANELAVLNTSGIRQAFRDRKVVLLRADWTNSSPAIEEALAGFGRNGVPLYLLYPGGKGSTPRILPQILTPQIVRGELEKLPKRD